jgi:hypothetical protein
MSTREKTPCPYSWDNPIFPVLTKDFAGSISSAAFTPENASFTLVDFSFYRLKLNALLTIAAAFARLKISPAKQWEDSGIFP